MNLMNDKKAGNQSWQVVFDELPTTLDMFSVLPQTNMQQPYYAAALLIPALCMWPSNQNVAVDMINCLRGKEYLPFSYFEGTTPSNGYEPSKPYTVTISTVPTSFDEAGYAKLYLKSSGADSPRPVQLRKKQSSGEWFLWDQMLLSEIRPPVSTDPWA